MKLQPNEYARMVQRASPPSAAGRDCLWAFFVGGGICLLGEALRQFFLRWYDAPMAGTLTSMEHWVLLVTENEDGTVVVYDPTSPDVSAHPWAPATLASTCDTLYVLRAADAGTEGDAAE